MPKIATTETQILKIQSLFDLANLPVELAASEETGQIVAVTNTEIVPKALEALRNSAVSTVKVGKAHIFTFKGAPKTRGKRKSAEEASATAPQTAPKQPAGKK